MVVREPEKILTDEEFEELYAGKPYELVRGEVVEIMPAGGESPEVELVLGGAIAQFVIKNKLGKVTGAEGGYWLMPGTMRAPDIGFYSWEKHKLHTEPDKFRPFPPDLAVEVVSPTDRASDVQLKVDLYRESGVKLVWVVYPESHKIVAHYPDGTGRTYSENELLDGEDVLPGFALKVAEVFPPQPEA
jgi:Uma2 family endonuclease